MGAENTSRPGADGTAEPGGAGTRIAPSWLRRSWPLLVLLAGLGMFLGLRLDRYVGFASLKEHRAVLLDLVARHRAAMAAGFFATYALCVAFSLPVATVLTIAGGFLFGQVQGTVLVVAGATVGATAVFLAARTAFGDTLRRRAGPWLRRMEDGFRENALSYLMVLRLVPLFPFVAVNLVPAVLGVGLRDFVLATFFGIMPASAVYVGLGVGVGSVFDQGGEVTLAGVLTPQVIAALLALACLALVPVVYKALQRPR